MTAPRDHERPAADSPHLPPQRTVAKDLARSGMDLAGRGPTGFAIETLSDEEFERLLELDRVRETRMNRLILNRLEEGKDYGKVPGVDKPFPWEGAADKVAKFLRLVPQLTSDPVVSGDGDCLTATVTVGIWDVSGRLVTTTSRACSTRERRFQKKTSGKWKYDDPRECANECIAMALKRAKVAGILSAAGVKQIFANPDQLVDDEEFAEKERTRPLAADELKALTAEASAAGIKTKKEWAAVLDAVMGAEDRAITVADAVQIREVLAQPHRVAELRAAAAGAAAAPTASPTASPPASPGGTDRPPSDGQIKLYRQLLRASVFTDAERETAEAALATGQLTFSTIGARIDEAIETTRTRSAAQRAATAPAAAPDAEDPAA